MLKTENRNNTNQKKGHAHYANYEQIDSWTHCSGFRHHLFVAVVDVDTDSRLHRRNKCSVAMIDSVLSEPEATAIGAACFGSGLLRLRLVQQERHAQVLGWFLCGHDDGSGPCHGSNDYCRLAAAAPFSDESGGAKLHSGGRIVMICPTSLSLKKPAPPHLPTLRKRVVVGQRQCRTCTTTAQPE